MISVNELDRRVTFERAVATTDDFGHEIREWRELATVSAGFRPVRDTERFSGDETKAELTARFRVRWSPVLAGLTPQDRLVFQGDVFEIVGIKELGRREGLEITAGGRAD